MLPGCLVDDPPPYIAPHQTPPRLDYTAALPLLDQVIVTNSGESVEFNMPVTSEDAGDALFATLFLDFEGDGMGSEILRQGRLPASTLDDSSIRMFSLLWGVRNGVDPGCHRITLRVTHSANFSETGAVLDKKDLAEAFWFANVNVSPDSANALVDCPQASSRGPAQ